MAADESGKKGQKVDLTERDLMKLLKVDGMPRDLDSSMVDLFTLGKKQYYCFLKYEHSPSLVSYACIVVFPSHKVFRAGYTWSAGRSKPSVSVFGIVRNSVKCDFPRALYCRESDGVLVTKSVAEFKSCLETESEPPLSPTICAARLLQWETAKKKSNRNINNHIYYDDSSIKSDCDHTNNNNNNNEIRKTSSTNSNNNNSNNNGVFKNTMNNNSNGKHSSSISKKSPSLKKTIRRSDRLTSSSSSPSSASPLKKTKLSSTDSSSSSTTKTFNHLNNKGTTNNNGNSTATATTPRSATSTSVVLSPASTPATVTPPSPASVSPLFTPTTTTTTANTSSSANGDANTMSEFLTSVMRRANVMRPPPQTTKAAPSPVIVLPRMSSFPSLPVVGLESFRAPDQSAPTPSPRASSSTSSSSSSSSSSSNSSSSPIVVPDSPERTPPIGSTLFSNSLSSSSSTSSASTTSFQMPPIPPLPEMSQQSLHDLAALPTTLVSFFTENLRQNHEMTKIQLQAAKESEERERKATMRAWDLLERVIAANQSQQLAVHQSYAQEQFGPHDPTPSNPYVVRTVPGGKIFSYFQPDQASSSTYSPYANQ